VDTAPNLGQGGDKAFSKQAQTHIAHALEILFELKPPCDFARCVITAVQSGPAERRNETSKTSRNTAADRSLRPLATVFLHPPPEQFAGVRETIGLPAILLTPEVARCFATGKAPFDFSAI